MARVERDFIALRVLYKADAVPAQSRPELMHYLVES